MVHEDAVVHKGAMVHKGAVVHEVVVAHEEVLSGLYSRNTLKLNILVGIAIIRW